MSLARGQDQKLVLAGVNQPWDNFLTPNHLEELPQVVGIDGDKLDILGIVGDSDGGVVI